MAARRTLKYIKLKTPAYFPQVVYAVTGGEAGNGGGGLETRYIVIYITYLKV